MKLHKTPSARRQQGAILIMTAAFIVAAVALLALAVDTGRLYAAQAKLQSAANLAALSAARVASECRPDLSQTDGMEAASDAVKSNFSARTANGNPPEVTTYDQGFVQLNPKDGLYAFSTSGPKPDSKPNAVRVRVTDADYSPLFSSFFKTSKTSLSASAGAISQPTAALTFGTTLAGANPDLLSALLGIQLKVASLGNLAQANVSLADLVGLDTNLVTRNDVATLDLKTALENILKANAGINLNSPARTVVNAVSNALGKQPLSNVLDLAGPVGGDTSIALGNIVSAAAQLVAADRKKPVSLPISLNNLPLGLGGVDVDVKILNPPKTVIGPAGEKSTDNYYTTAYSSQVSIGLNLHLKLGLGQLLTIAKVQIPLVLQVAQGRADLVSITCPNPRSPHPSYTVTTQTRTAPVAIGIGSVNDDGSINTGSRIDVTVLGTKVAEVYDTNDGMTTVPAIDSQQQNFDDIRNLQTDLPQIYPSTKAEIEQQELRGEYLATLVDNINLDYELLQNEHGGLLGGLFDTLGDLLTGLTKPILRTALNGISALLHTLLTGNILAEHVIDPIFNLLGISVASPTLTLESLSPANPRLFCASTSDCGLVAGANGNNKKSN